MDTEKEHHKKQTLLRSISSNPSWNKIADILLRVSKGVSIQQLKIAIKNFHGYTMIDRKYKSQMNFYTGTSLQQLFKEYRSQLPEIYSNIARFILQRHDKIQIPIFYQNQATQSNILKTDVLFMICSMAFFLINQQYYHQAPDLEQDFNHLKDFGCIFSDQKFKTKCVIQYIKKQLDLYFKDKEQYNRQILTIKRIVLEEQLSVEKLIDTKQGIVLKKPQLFGSNVSIQQFNGHIKADFANKYIGGGALFGGNVQEEIMFSVHPQLFITPLICQVMKANEALFFIGFKKYFKNRGYGYNVSYDGWQTSKYQIQDIQTIKNEKKISQYRIKQYIAGIDAIYFAGYPNKQFSKSCIDRQILKAYAGFSGAKGQQKQNEKEINVATGNWGCGMFNGTHCLKFIIQWIACSLVGKKMIYCTFGSENLINNKQVLTLLEGKRVNEAYNILMRAAQKVSKKPCSIYDEILKLLNSKEK